VPIEPATFGARALLGTLALVVPGCFGTSVAHEEDAIIVRATTTTTTTTTTVTKATIDHSAFDALLKRHVDEHGLVDYAAWKRADTLPLERYLVAMTAVRPTELSNDERLAYWINVYNALTLHGMLHFYPTASIRAHVAHVFGFKFWDDLRIEIEGQQRSLNGIEHEILRMMGEPRIHFAIVCASLSCPRLLAEAYTGARVSTQLEENTRAFFANPTNFSIDVTSKTVHLSSLLKWYSEDFGRTEREKLEFVARFLSTEQARTFLRRDDLAVDYLGYDWQINDRPKR